VAFKTSKAPGEPNLRQLLINLQGGKGFDQVIVSSRDECSIQFPYAWLGRHQHYDPGVFDQFVAQMGDEFQAISLVGNPIHQYKIGRTHSVYNLNGLLKIVCFGNYEPTHGK
jgi:hypothetical protein